MGRFLLGIKNVILGTTFRQITGHIDFDTLPVSVHCVDHTAFVTDHTGLSRPSAYSGSNDARVIEVFRLLLALNCLRYLLVLQFGNAR
jgi:hypothetical protein